MNLGGGPSAGDNNGAALIQILLELGPTSTSNAGTLREALRLVTQKIPNYGGSNANNNAAALSWKEPAVARLIHFFAAVGTTNANAAAMSEKENALSAAFVGKFIMHTLSRVKSFICSDIHIRQLSFT